MKDETITKLIVMNSGDSSVGLQGFEFEVEIKESHGFFDEETKTELISFMKEKLKEFCEPYDGHTTIATQEEIDNMIDIEVDKADHLNEGD